jgi:hypothetical protein
MNARKILLLEPNYKNKYPPMGLMKIATYYRCRRDDVRFYKGDLKEFAARLLLEEYLDSNSSNETIDKIVFSFISKRGPNKLIEYIKTGKHAPLKIIAEFPYPSNLDKERVFVDLINKFSEYRNRYKNENFPKFDKIAITTLFTFYWKETIDTILFAKKLCKHNGKVFVGGIASSLVPEYIEEETGITPIKGILNKPNILDNDKHGDVIIDELPLDYSILEEIDYRYPVENAYFGYMTRGCVNRCPFCAVPKLEPEYCSYISINEKIQKVNDCFGNKRHLFLMDNNVFASDDFDKIVDEINDCGFGKGATYVHDNEYDIAFRNLTSGFKLGTGKAHKVFNDRAYTRKMISLYDKITDCLESKKKGEFYSLREKYKLLFYETATIENIKKIHANAKYLYDKHFKQNKNIRAIDFNQGLDGRRVNKNKMEKIAEIEIRPMRIAFDSWKMRNKYEKSIRAAYKAGIKNLSNYLLYNYKDHPDDLYKRIRLNIDLCEELDITIYSFPMKYHPIVDPAYFRNRDYIGEPYWNRKFIRAIQAILNSTHGKIGRGKDFFEAAFGKDIEEFHKILWMPETLIVQRYKYDKEKRVAYYGAGSTPYDCIDESTGLITSKWFDEYLKLNIRQRVFAEDIIAKNIFTDADINIDDKQVKHVLKYYQITRDNH